MPAEEAAYFAVLLIFLIARSFEKVDPPNLVLLLCFIYMHL